VSRGRVARHGGGDRRAGRRTAVLPHPGRGGHGCRARTPPVPRPHRGSAAGCAVSLVGALVDVRPLRASANFRRLWISTSASTFGQQVAVVAVLAQAWELTEIGR